MNDDIVTRLNNDAERCFITEVVRNYADAVDEIERLRAEYLRWRAVAICYICRPAEGNYCPDHYQSMGAPAPWGPNG